jgi:hypothetical protein|tara:strand:- start:227 stop:385 length:159 start_codon:yes stop_codon:yes gene_type:complete
MVNYKDEFISSKKKKSKPKQETLQRDRKCKVNVLTPVSEKNEVHVEHDFLKI